MKEVFILFFVLQCYLPMSNVDNAITISSDTERKIKQTSASSSTKVAKSMHKQLMCVLLIFIIMIKTHQKKGDFRRFMERQNHILRSLTEQNTLILRLKLIKQTDDSSSIEK